MGTKEVTYALLPCPFCGNTEVELWDGLPAYESSMEDAPYKRWTIVCSVDDEGCGASCGYDLSMEGAVERWNERFDFIDA